MSFKVVAPLVLARDSEGKVHHHYAGSVIAWLPDDQRAHFLELGLVVDVGGPIADELSAGDGKPDANATNKELIAWLVAYAVKEDGSDYTEAELGPPLKKADLRALVDSVE